MQIFVTTIFQSYGPLYTPLFIIYVTFHKYLVNMLRQLWKKERLVSLLLTELHVY